MASDKLDEILAALHRMQPVVEDTGERVKGLEAAVKSTEIKNAEQDVNIRNIGYDLNRLGSKVQKHLDGHWAWVGSLIAAGTAMVGLAMKLLDVRAK